MPEGASPERHLEVGEMIVDAVWLRHPTRRRLDPPKIVLFPGSRDYIAKFILPFFAKVADVVASQRGDVTFSVARSRFLSRDFLLTIPDVNDGRPIEGDNMTVDCDGDRMTLRTSGGTRLEVEEPRAAIDGASYAVTLPGTATAELAALGIPMAVVLPTYWGETAPLPGLAGHLTKVPALGRYLKRIAGHIHLRRHPVLAHPNLRAGRTIVPELVGRICAADVARPVLDSLAGDREKTSADLIAAMGPDGGAQRVAAILADYLRRPDVVPAGSPRSGTD
jgi:lipid-A-disaccharide synthase